MRFLVRIHREGDWSYPHECKYPGIKKAPRYTLFDRIENLVHVTAHEIFHLTQYEEGVRTGEASVDAIAIRILEEFRGNRDELLSEWNGVPAMAVPKPKKDLTEARAAKAIASLERWQRKLKMAQTKIRKYKRQVRYYERRQSAKGG